MKSEIINQLDGNIGWKDLQLRHLGCNTQLAHALNLSSPHDIIGLKDSDLYAHTAADIQFHYDNDQLALQGKIIKCIHFHNDNFFFLIKKPLFNKKNIINGIIYHCHKLENTKIFSEQNIIENTFKINTNTNPFHFSKREIECIFHLLRGKKSRQIAEALHLSKRTIDFYIENIKNKMGCHTKSELLLAAIKAGYSSLLY